MRPVPSNDSTSPYSRSMPNLGFDPCPGDVDQTALLARGHDGLARELRSLSSQLEGVDFAQWQGEAANAVKSSLLDHVAPALRDAAGAIDDLATGLQSWYVKLSGFQDEADALERSAAVQAAVLDDIDARLVSNSVLENKAQDWSGVSGSLSGSGWGPLGSSHFPPC